MKKSKWNGQACRICAAGILHDGSKTVTQKYKGHPYQAQVRGQAKPVAAVINLFKLLDKHPDLIKELV